MDKVPKSTATMAEYTPTPPVMEEDHSKHEEHVEASAVALDDLTTAAGENHDAPPDEHIHRPAAAPQAHSWIRRWIPQAVQEEYEVYYHLGNYVIDRQTGKKTMEDMSIYVRLGMHFLYYGYYQQKFLTTSRAEGILKAQSEKMGAMYDAPESKSHIVPFIESFKLWESMKDMVKEKPEDYATFNDFFSREIKPEARPVDEPENELVVCSVADCRLTVFPTIDLATNLWIKGTPFTMVELMKDAELAQYFDGGSIVVHRLAPQDYHRWHSPVTGTVESIKEIDGAYYTVNPQAINQPGTLNVFCQNRRDVAIIKREATGSKIVVVAVSNVGFPLMSILTFLRSVLCSWAPSSGCLDWRSQVL